jgi:hypothetical protein
MPREAIELGAAEPVLPRKVDEEGLAADERR